MRVIDRAHRLVLIILATVVPTAFVVDFAIEASSGGGMTLPGWPVYAAISLIAAIQLSRKHWDADWVIVGTGLLTAILGILSHNGTTTIIDLQAGTVIVAFAGLIAIAISRRVPIISGGALGIATVYMVSLSMLSEDLEADDVIIKAAIVAILFGFGGWLLYQLRRGYEEQYASRDRFVAAVSHELRTPLTALVGFSTTLSDNTVEPDSPEADEILSIITDQAHEAADIVEDLLVAFRQQPGEIPLQIGTTDLAEEAQTVVSAFTSTRSSGSQRVSLEGDRVIVAADPLRLRQIIRNLVTNAHRHGGDQMTVHTYQKEGYGFVAVADNGQGFDPDEAEMLFKPYGRSRHTDTSTGSVGLGLTVARQLARLMGGDLTARRDEESTVFELELPLAETCWEGGD